MIATEVLLGTYIFRKQLHTDLLMTNTMELFDEFHIIVPFSWVGVLSLDIATLLYDDQIII
jgi:hypothetical protein